MLSIGKKIGESDIEFAIIRAGYGKFASQKDPRFDENMRNAQAEGINCGTYWYSYALTVEDAYKEAEVCYEIIKNYDFNFPIYYDVEDPSQTGLSATQISAIIEAFCTTLQSKGCYVGIYSYANFLTTHVLTSVLEKYDVWVAHFGISAPAFADYGIWQYTSSGNISGINGSVDLNYSYINYPYIISPETYTEPPAENPSIPSPPGSPESNVVAQGIDVSEWQGNINWKAVKSAGIDYAIIRAGYGKYDFQKDAKFDENMKKAQEVGVDRGVYWYSYASTTEDAVKEAEVCYNIIKDYKLEYPVYFNIEDNSVKNLSVSELTAIVEAFCSYMEDKGYYVGIASYSSFLNTKLDPSVFKKYDVWVAHYGVSAPQYYGNFGMWQYTEKASVDGVQTLVCRSYCYYDYPEIIKKNHLCGY